jgi:hypothetical protein
MILIAITDNVNNAMKSEKIIESRYIWHYMWDFSLCKKEIYSHDAFYKHTKRWGSKEKADFN